MRYILLLFLLISCTHHKTPEKKIVLLQPYKGFSAEEISLVKAIIDSCYHYNVIVADVKELPKSAYTSIKSPRYCADSLLVFQKRIKPNKVDFIIGLTHEDICITKKDKKGNIKQPIWKYTDWGIMGLGFCPGTSCIVSSYRLKSTNNKLYKTRLKKVVVHEFGHNLGLPHCPDKRCVMTDAAESIATIDHAKLGLCKKCYSKLN